MNVPNNKLDVLNHNSSDQDKHDFAWDTDLDRHFCNALGVHCRYYTYAQFNDCHYRCSGISIANINCRSMHCKFSKPHDYLNCPSIKFDIIDIIIDIIRNK